jgi:hypothetical protein
MQRFYKDINESLFNRMEPVYLIPCAWDCATAACTASTTDALNSLDSAGVPMALNTAETLDSGRPAAMAAAGTRFAIEFFVSLVRMVV